MHVMNCQTLVVQVIKLISQVIADFANGEISQQQKVFDSSMTLDEYMDKNFYKTASLIAASCKSAAVFSECSQDIKDSMFEYGRHLGLAFQIIDDILDFTQTAEQLGKPQVRLHQHVSMLFTRCIQIAIASAVPCKKHNNSLALIWNSCGFAALC